MFDWLKRQPGVTSSAATAGGGLDPLVARSEQLYERMTGAEEADLTVVVGPSGASSATFRGQAFWTMTCAVIGWRVGQRPMERRRLMIRRRGQRGELDAFRSQLKPYSVFRIKARLLDEPDSEPQALLEQVLGEETGDAELAALAHEQQQPVFHDDADLGRFEFDRRLNWYSRSLPWDGSTAKLNLTADDKGQISSALNVAKELWKAQAAWSEKVGKFAAAQLVSLKNDSWLDSGEAPLTESDFAGKVQMESVIVDPDGACEFWLKDGGLFAGHSILVRGSVSDGLLDADCRLNQGRDTR